MQVGWELVAIPLYMLAVLLFIKVMSGEFDFKHLASAMHDKRKAAEADLEAERLRTERERRTTSSSD